MWTRGSRRARTGKRRSCAARAPVLSDMKAVTADLAAETVRAARGSRSFAFLLFALVVLAPAVVGDRQYVLTED